MKTQELVVEKSSSIVSFGQRTGEVGGHNRYLAIDGREAFDLGYPCATCTTLFSRVDSARLPMSPHEVSDALTEGIMDLHAELLDTISAVLPRGEYTAAILSMRPRLVAPADEGDYFAHEYLATRNVPHDPATPYYRGRSFGFPSVMGQRGRGPDEEMFHELAVPLYPPTECDPAAVAHWEMRLRAGVRPTALAISVLEIIGIGYWEGDFEPNPWFQWVLTHYILDGHHKMLAAANVGAEIGVLSVLKRDGVFGNPLWEGQMYTLIEQYGH